MIRTAECVSPKHPDKLCDQISDAIVDACLEQDPYSRCAIETMGGHGIITITGELTTNAYVNIKDIVHSVVEEKYGVQINVVKQSNEIARGVDEGGAGDQGIMIGYACDENEALIPMELYMARSLCQFIYERFPFDGKTQVTINENNEIISIIASFQNASTQDLQSIVTNWIGMHGYKLIGEILVNTAGDWNIGGFDADTGVTGRKIVVDAYGPRVPVGGGAFSGKDSTKVDRSAAYMARSIAVAMLKRNNLKECLISVAYAIGKKEPLMVEAKVTNQDGLQKIETFTVCDAFEPQKIIDYLDLRKPIYLKTSQWGHFGNNFKWDE